MIRLLKKVLGLAKTTAEETIENASEELKEVVNAIKEDSEKVMYDMKETMDEVKKDLSEKIGDGSDIMTKAKDAAGEAIAEVKKEFNESIGDTDLVEKARKMIKETTDKFKSAASEEWDNAKDKFEDLADDGKKV
jgi:phage-related protein